MMARWYCVLTCLSIVLANDELSFDKWLDKYGHTIESVDYETWKANLEFVVAHNQRYSSFYVTMNKFAHVVRSYHDIVY